MMATPQVKPSIDYEALVLCGEELARRMDRDRLELGHLASLVTTTYGEKTLHEYASLINMKYKTLQEYKTVYLFFQNSAARKFLDKLLYPTLAYTHFRLAARIKPLSQALLFLETCARDSLTPEQAEYTAGTESDSPKKIAEFEIEVSAEYFPFLVTPLPENVQPGKRYLLTIREVKQES